MKCCQLWNKFVTDGIFIYKLFNFKTNCYETESISRMGPSLGDVVYVLFM